MSVHCSDCGYEGNPEPDVEEIIDGVQTCFRCGNLMPVLTQPKELIIELFDRVEELENKINQLI